MTRFAFPRRLRPRNERCRTPDTATPMPRAKPQPVVMLNAMDATGAFRTAENRHRPDTNRSCVDTTHCFLDTFGVYVAAHRTTGGKLMKNLSRRLFVTLLCLVLPTCGSSTPTAPPGPPPTTLPSRGAWSLSVTPDPIIATPSGDREFPWGASWRVTIRDTAGLHGDVNRVSTTARNNFGFTFVVSDFNPDQIIRGIGTNHIDRNGTLTFSDGMSRYRADGNGGQQITLTIAAEIIDANGNRITTSSDVRITAQGSVVQF